MNRSSRQLSLSSALRQWLRPWVRTVANKVVAQSDLPARVTTVQHEGRAAALDLVRQPWTVADERLLEVVSVLCPRHRPAADWCRVGGPSDGGYVMADDLSGTAAVSIGVGWDDTWEADALRRGATLAVQMDPTIRRPPRRLAGAEFHRIGLGAATDVADGRRSLVDALGLAGAPSERGLTLKVDVEGAEWTAFSAAPPDWGTSVRQFAVELHGLGRLHDPEFARLVLSALGRMAASHVPVHVQANNAVRLELLGAYAVPAALEVTWVRSDLVEPWEPATLRHPLAAPNDPRVPWVDLDGWLSR